MSRRSIVASSIRRLRTPGIRSTPAGRAALDAVITKQAQIIAYIDDYKFLMIATLAVLPLLIVFRKPAGAPPAEPIVVE